PEIEQLGLDLQTTIDAAPTIGDPRLAKRLVTNLVDNALRHNIAHGYIDTVTRTQSDQAVLTIANSGPIIPEADIDRLFQPFQRLHSNRTYHADSHGLGLSIVQSIAAAHGATLNARADPDGGFQIEVRFPPPPATSSGNGAPLIRRGDTDP
ncbi:MAG TPA: ATP-binding protein, partial [Solirubrobacteraceae bacterium]